MDVLLETFKEINKIGQVACGSGFHWNMDDLVKFTIKTRYPSIQYSHQILHFSSPSFNILWSGHESFNLGPKYT